MARILIKPDVEFKAFAPAGAVIITALKAIAKASEFDITITSGTDSLHSGPDDPHHKGEAYDIRSQGLTQTQKFWLLNQLRLALYKTPDSARKFYAFLENAGGPNEHIHIQRRAGIEYTMLDYLEED